MTLDTSDLVIKLLLALAFVLVIVVFIIILSIVGKTFNGKEKKSTNIGTEIATKKVKISGKQLNDLFQYSVYFLIFIVFCLFLMFSYSIFQTEVNLIDLWPFIFLIIILILYSLSLIERQKTRSKRTIQRDMREL